MNVTLNKKQWLIDLLFGAALIVPIAYTAVTGDLRGSYMAVGVSVSYTLHTAEKMLSFHERLKQAVEEEAEERVEREAKEQVEKQVEETTRS